MLLQSPMFDGKMTHWYHYECFFKKQKIRNVAEISNFESIRWEDQENIKKKIGTVVYTLFILRTLLFLIV